METCTRSHTAYMYFLMLALWWQDDCVATPLHAPHHTCLSAAMRWWSAGSPERTAGTRWSAAPA